MGLLVAPQISDGWVDADARDDHSAASGDDS